MQLDRRAMRFLWEQLKGPDLWMLVLMGVMTWYIVIWQRRVRDSILNQAGMFAKGIYRAAI